MRIFYISDRQDGGISRHVKCLRACLPSDVASYEIGKDGDEEFSGRNGHDVRELIQAVRVVRQFKPDLVHFNTLPFWIVIFVKLFTRLPIVVSIHMPYDEKTSLKTRFMFWLLRSSYYLPVSNSTWQTFIKYQNGLARGEVLYNPLKVSRGILPKSKTVRKIVGMVGRNADQKDWPMFCKVCQEIHLRGQQVSFIGIGVTEGEAKSIFGKDAEVIKWKGAQLNGREWIGKMDVFVLTSKHEQMPTVVLETLAERTAICGFIPEGGMSEILEYSDGPLKDVFLKDRDACKLAEIVCSLLRDDDKREAVVEDGWRIVNEHFSAEKLVKERLVPLYHSLINA